MIVLPVFSATESTGRVAAALCHEVGEELAEKHAYLSGAKRDECWVLGLPPSGAKPGFLGCRQAGWMLGSWQTPSGINAGFLGCRQAGWNLGSWIAAKRGKTWVLGLPPSGINTGLVVSGLS